MSAKCVRCGKERLVSEMFSCDFCAADLCAECSAQRGCCSDECEDNLRYEL